MAGENDKEVHPGSWLGDGVEEFKKLPMWGKIAVGVLLVGVVGFAIYKIRQNQAASANSATQSALSGTAAGSPGGGSQSPFPMVNGLPVLPQGTNPIYDPNGNLIGYQNQPPAPTPNPNPGTPLPPVPGPQGPPPGGPLIPYGLYNGPSYSNLQPNTYFSWAGIKYLLSTGGGGRLYGQVNGQGNKILLYAPLSQYPPGTVPQGQGANFQQPNGSPQQPQQPGGNLVANTGSTAGMMNNPLQYTAAAQPHISSAHVSGGPAGVR